jgi:hypothetical protein
MLTLSKQANPTSSAMRYRAASRSPECRHRLGGSVVRTRRAASVASRLGSGLLNVLAGPKLPISQTFGSAGLGPPGVGFDRLTAFCRAEHSTRSAPPGFFFRPLQQLIRCLSPPSQRCSCLGSPCQFYLTLFNQRSMSFRFVSSPSSPSDVGVPPPEEKYTGCILVSGYHVLFLPSKFPHYPSSAVG